MLKRALAFLVVASPFMFALMGASAHIHTQGDYGTRNTSVRVNPTATQDWAGWTALVGNCSCGSFQATWIAGDIYGLTPSPRDQSAEGVTVIHLTPSAPINGAPYVALSTRTVPNWKIHAGRWGNDLVFTVKLTCTRTKTPTSTATGSPTYTSTPTPTRTATRTATATATCNVSSTPICSNQ